jgi:ABC-type branched-subunit amino acid transport system ATPase component
VTTLSQAEPSSMVEPTIGLSVRDIVVQYGGVRAVDGVSLDVKPGVVTGILGPNGAGKSSLANVIAGRRRPSTGTVLLDQKDITKLRPHARSRRGLICTFQTAKVFGRMSALENVVAGSACWRHDGIWSSLIGRRRWYGEERKARDQAAELLAGFGLTEKRYMPSRELSGGERRIVEYLRAVMAQPRVLVLDEPSVGMAPWAVERLEEEIRHLQTSDVGILLIGHEMDFMRSICNDLVVMANGQVIARGSFAEVERNPQVIGAYLGRA